MKMTRQIRSLALLLANSMPQTCTHTAALPFSPTGIPYYILSPVLFPSVPADTSLRPAALPLPLPLQLPMAEALLVDEESGSVQQLGSLQAMLEEARVIEAESTRRIVRLHMRDLGGAFLMPVRRMGGGGGEGRTSTAHILVPVRGGGGRGGAEGKREACFWEIMIVNHDVILRTRGSHSLIFVPWACLL